MNKNSINMLVNWAVALALIVPGVSWAGEGQFHYGSNDKIICCGAGGFTPWPPVPYHGSRAPQFEINSEGLLLSAGMIILAGWALGSNLIPAPEPPENVTYWYEENVVYYDDYPGRLEADGKLIPVLEYAPETIYPAAEFIPGPVYFDFYEAPTYHDTIPEYLDSPPERNYEYYE